MITKDKLCKCGCGKSGKIWSKGMLKQCFFRLNPQKPLKKSYISKQPSEKQLQKKALKTERTKEIHKAMYNWWMKWKELHENKCMSCGCNLPSEFHTWMVDHLLEKSTYPEFALEEHNFYLTCFDDHSNKTNGFPHPKHKIAINKAKYLLLNKVN